MICRSDSGKRHSDVLEPTQRPGAIASGLFLFLAIVKVVAICDHIVQEGGGHKL